MKVKLESAYAEIDLDQLSIDQLHRLRDEVDGRIKRITGPNNATLAVALQSANNCHTRIGYALEAIIGKPYEEIRMDEIPQKVRITDLMKHRNFGKKSVDTLNHILVSHGYTALAS